MMVDLKQAFDDCNDEFVADAKIINDIYEIAEMYWAGTENLRIVSTDCDFIHFSFKYGMMTFSGWEYEVIRKTLKKMGYEFNGFIVSSWKNSLYLRIHMRTISRRRQAKELLSWIYNIPKRIYYRYRYWKNYGTWRY